MATYYADLELVTGNNDGSSWEDAWQTIEDAIAGTNGSPPDDSDTVYVRGDQTLTSSVTLNNAGSGSSGMIKWIGCNAAGVNDGTRVVLDASNLSLNDDCFTVTGPYNHFENFAFTGATGTGVGCQINGTICTFVNCAAYSNGGYGFAESAICQGLLMVRCTSYSNGDKGFITYQGTRFFFCSSHDNSADGFDFGIQAYQAAIGCLSYDNGGAGFHQLQQGEILFNCVIDANADDGIENYSSSYYSIVMGCRVTNHAITSKAGLDCKGTIYRYGWNYFEDNDTNVADAANAETIRQDGVETNQEDQDDTYEGYTDKGDGEEDYNLRSDATLRRHGIPIPVE